MPHLLERLDGDKEDYLTDHFSFPTSGWMRAATLKERLAVNLQSSKPEHERKLLPWRAMFPTTAVWLQRLAAAGLSEETFSALLGESTEELAQRIPDAPSWLTDLEQAYSRAGAKDEPWPWSQFPIDFLGFLNLAEPLLRQGRDRLREGIRRLTDEFPERPFDPVTVEPLLLMHLPRPLLALLSRTLVLELNVARVQGTLEGDTPEERFHSFTARLSRPEVALALWQEYPVLARQVVTVIDQWAEFGVEFLRHLCEDWPTIKAAFAEGREPGFLVDIDDGAGDRHRGGRSVLVLRFASGLKLVYKPKPLAVEARFQRLLAWLNKRGAQPAFRLLNVLDGGDHGWVEFISDDGCSSPAALKRFYQRMGGYLALLTVLAATDFHFENVIASGEDPMLIDLEALFHREMPGPAKDVARQGLNRSVMTVKLLPMPVWVEGVSEAVDFSGLGAKAGQPTPFSVAAWQGQGTDEMRITRERASSSAGRHRPKLNGVEADWRDYQQHVQDGFAATYCLLHENQKELLAEDGPIADCADVPVRFIARISQIYAILHQQGDHPDFLRDGLDRDRLFDRLWTRVAEVPALARLVEAEVADLNRGDIPMFQTRPG